MSQRPARIIVRTTVVVLLLICDVQQPFWAAIALEQTPQSTPQLVAVVRVDNVAAVPESLLQAAKSRAADVYYKIKVSITWVDIAQDRDRPGAAFTLVLVKNGEGLGPFKIAQDALGLAVPSTHRAWVFYDRIEAAKDRVPVIGILLGDVMAHELGHLMLFSADHSLAGIMSAQLLMKIRPTDTFTKRQAAGIANRLLQIQSSGDSTK